MPFFACISYYIKFPLTVLCLMHYSVIFTFKQKSKFSKTLILFCIYRLFSLSEKNDLRFTNIALSFIFTFIQVELYFGDF